MRFFPVPRQDLYRAPESRVEYQLYSNEYFSGADVYLYFGDIWVDEITELSFQLQEQVMPIYGYHSYTYDTVARGRRLIQGSFSLNFKGVGYLQSILGHALALDYMADQLKAQGAKPEFFSKHKLEDVLKIYGKESFAQLADEYEKALWGEQEDPNSRLSYAGSTYFPEDRFGFDIRVNYGAVSETQQHKSVYDTRKGIITPNTTVETINGVQLTSYGKTMGTSQQGQPIQEVYSFMARDLNGPFYPYENQV